MLRVYNKSTQESNSTSDFLFLMLLISDIVASTHICSHSAIEIPSTSQTLEITSRALKIAIEPLSGSSVGAKCRSSPAIGKKTYLISCEELLLVLRVFLSDSENSSKVVNNSGSSGDNPGFDTRKLSFTQTGLS